MAIPRRRFARSAVGLAGLESTAGCLDALSNPEPAFLSYKAITVRWRRDRTQGYVADLCLALVGRPKSDLRMGARRVPDVVRSPTEVTLSERTFRRLRDRFAGVELVLGFSRADTTDLALLESDLGQVAVSRDRFNRVQFGDRITVARTESGVRVRDVEDAAHGDPTGWTVQIGTKDLVSQFPDSRVPEPT